jgi:hypothetical protein
LDAEKLRTELMLHPRNGRAECISLIGKDATDWGAAAAGTLCCLKSRGGLFMLFNDKRIAKRGHSRTRGWLPLDASWIVTSIDSGDLLVQHNDDQGVVVSLGGGGK